GGQRPDGPAGPGARGVRGRRRARPGGLGGIRDRRGHHVRLAGPDDRGLRAGPGRGDGCQVGERRRGRRAGWLDDHGALQPGRGRPVHSPRQQSPPAPPLPGVRRRLLRYRAVRAPRRERTLMTVEIAGLTRRFGRTQAVAGVDLSAGPGVFGLLGPNGAGKTSLLRMMATVIPPSSGRLRLLGRDPGGYGPRREVRPRLGPLPPNPGHYPRAPGAGFRGDLRLPQGTPARPLTA